MEFNLRAIKGFASTAFSRAVQYTEEKLGTSDKTELDEQYEELAEKCDKTRMYTERIVNRTMSVLEPNPNYQVADLILEKLDKKQDRLTRNELLGDAMIESGLEFGSHTIYGSALIKVGETQQQLGKLEKQFVEQSIKGFVQPLTKFLNDDIRTIMLEQRQLTAKRLDLDAAKNRIKKAKSLETQSNAEQDLKIAEEKFNKQVEITKLLLEAISSAQTNHVRCLSEFVDSQIKYYTDCHKQMIELQYQLAQLSTRPNSNANQSTNNATKLNGRATNEQLCNGRLKLTKQPINTLFKVNDLVSPSDEQLGDLPANKKRARVLNDYTAEDSSQMNLTMNEIIIVNLDYTEDSDFLLAERGLEKDKLAPISHLEIMN